MGITVLQNLENQKNSGFISVARFSFVRMLASSFWIDL
jgi:hypothetical protein